MFNLFKSIVELDGFIAQALYLNRTLVLDNFFLVFTYLGEWLIIALCLLVLYLILRRLKLQFIAKYATLVVASAGIMTIILKALINRDRPAGDIPLYQESLSSFPSAHSALILAFWGF